MRRTASVIWLFLLLCSCTQNLRPDRHTRELLAGLDGDIKAREMYVVKKKDQMEALTRLASEIRDPQRRYDVEMRIAEAYFPFSFDSTQAYLKHCIELAGTDLERAQAATIRLGHLYDKSGNYMEAHQILYEQIDTARLSDSLKEKYLYVLYDFSHDLSGNSGMVERLSIPPEAPFRERLLSILPKNTETWRGLLRDKFIAGNQLEKADSVSRILLSSLQPEDRNYAIHAYYLSEIAEKRGRHEERLEWLVKSAKCDILNAVKDYASLTLVAMHVLPQDVEHSFRYLQIAQEDALFYNAKLRPWQISRFLLEVEEAYRVKQEQRQQIIRVSMILLAVLVAALFFITWFLVSRSRKLTRLHLELENANANLEDANLALGQLNRQIVKADQVKEAYILEFLETLANQIALFRNEDNGYRNLIKQGKADELLKELSIGSRSEKARDQFYQTFDQTFLGMYPSFVEEFNALLVPEARLSPPKGHLNTELRIFALIRLGVDDSKKIAGMLDYSVSTIYNYKVSVRNSALGERETFEERVKMIGK